MFTCSNNTHDSFLALFNYLSSQKIFSFKKFNYNHVLEKHTFEYTTTHEKHNAVGIFLKNKPLTDIKSIAILE